MQICLIASRNNLRFNSTCYAKGRKCLLRKNTFHLAFLSVCRQPAWCAWLGIYLVYGWWIERGNLKRMNEDTSESQLIHSCTGTASPAPHPTANFRRLFQDTDRGGRGRAFLLYCLVPVPLSWKGSNHLGWGRCKVLSLYASVFAQPGEIVPLWGEDPFGHRLLCEGIIAWERKELSSTNDSFVVSSHSEQHREPPPALRAFSSLKGIEDDFYSSVRQNSFSKQETSFKYRVC